MAYSPRFDHPQVSEQVLQRVRGPEAESAESLDDFNEDLKLRRAGLSLLGGFRIPPDLGIIRKGSPLKQHSSTAKAYFSVQP